MAWKWYVYEVTRDGAVVYVGKGCGKRMSHSARRLNGEGIEIAHFEHENAALDFERARIKERIAAGARLLNITHGNRLSWWKRTDTREMAREGLAEIANRVGRWIAGGRLHELSAICRITERRLIALHQQFAD